MSRPAAACLALWLVTALCGCGGGLSSSSFTLSSGQEDSAAKARAGKPVGNATAVYSNVARGALSCWFTTKGGFKKDFVYFAEAEAPSRGGGSVITIHKRDQRRPNPRGVRAYRIKIEPVDDESARMTTENLKMPESVAAAMESDVDRWARGEHGCSDATTAHGWDADRDDTGHDAHRPTAKQQKRTARSN